jgi:hypothetical protein
MDFNEGMCVGAGRKIENVLKYVVEEAATP